MKLTLAIIATSAAIATLSGCASPLDDSQESDQQSASEDGAVGSTSQAVWSAPANTVPPADAGFKMYKNFRGVWGMVNGQGRVGFESSSVLATRIYTRSTSERFAIYEMPGGTYNLCIPGTLARKTQSSDYGTYTYWEATCLYRGLGSHDLRFGWTPLSGTDPGSTGPFYAGEGDIKVQLGPRTGYDYWVIRGEYMTNNGKNVVVGGNKSGNDDQIWKAF